MKKQPNDIELAPFPQLRWDSGNWAGTCVLSAWAGFQSRGGAYGSRDSAKPSDGSVRLNVNSPDSDNGKPPSAAQAAAFRLLQEKQAEICDAMMAALLPYYTTMQASWMRNFLDEESKKEFSKLMPLVLNAQEFRRLIGLSTIHILHQEKKDIAYIGFEFGCTWDPEHALGFMMHGARVIEVGGAHVSFLPWKAKKDAEG